MDWESEILQAMFEDNIDRMTREAHEELARMAQAAYAHINPSYCLVGDILYLIPERPSPLEKLARSMQTTVSWIHDELIPYSGEPPR